MKELYAGHLYWPTTTAKPKDYAPLRQNIHSQVAIIGGGMSGVVCASILANSGLHTVLLERGDIAGGSTAANTGLLQYCNDIMLSDLIKQIGRSAAETLYKGCKEAIDSLSAAAKRLPNDVGFRRRSSMYFATSQQDLPKLKQEYETLRDCGFDVAYWSEDQISHHFPFRKPGAIITHHDAEVNPYHFVNELAKEASTAGLCIYEHTDIVKHDRLANGLHLLHTADSFEIQAEHVIYAVGYEPEELHSQLIKTNLNRTFAIVTGIQPSLSSWHQQFLLWETARPYLYLRTTGDGRVIVGGMDEDPAQPLHGLQIRRERSSQLFKELQMLFPELESPVEYEWNGTFGESIDGLPFIGEDPARKRVYYSLGYGGNGTVYSMIAAQVLRDLIHGQPNPLTDILKLNR